MKTPLLPEGFSFHPSRTIDSPERRPTARLDPLMPKRKLTLADVEFVARHMAPDWWDSLTAEERLDLVKRSNDVQAAEEFTAWKFQGKSKKARDI
jgi:hypothetical protein